MVHSDSCLSAEDCSPNSALSPNIKSSNRKFKSAIDSSNGNWCMITQWLVLWLALPCDTIVFYTCVHVRAERESTQRQELVNCMIHLAAMAMAFANFSILVGFSMPRPVKQIQ